MSWQGIHGHDEVVERFRRMLAANRLASTFLFVGPAGIGKRTFARKLAQTLLCAENDATAMNPCGRCPSCIQVTAGTHPDLLLVSRPQNMSVIPVASLIGERDKRGQEGFCHDLSLKPFVGGRKVGLIDDADYFKQPEASNCLLKTLEEPPPRSVLVLIGTSTSRQLPTIRSRSQIVRFQPLPPETVADILVEQGYVADPVEASRWATYSDGSVARAVELSDTALWSFRRELLPLLAVARVDSARLSKLVGDFVKEANRDAAEHRERLGQAADAMEEAATEAGERRARLRNVIHFAVEYYRQLMRDISGQPRTNDTELRTYVEQGRQQFRGDEELAAVCLERCLDALADIDKNANQQALIECWLDEIGLLQAGLALPQEV